MNEIDRAKIENELESEYQAIKFRETYNILKKLCRLKTKHFKLIEKQELIGKLQTAIKHGTTILFELENEEK